MAEPSPLLSAQDLSLERSGRPLFCGLCFDLYAGEAMQVMGANGAGKTSLLRVLAGLSRLGFEGQVLSGGQSIYDNTHDYLARLLYLGHRPGIKGLLSPRENLRWHLAGREPDPQAIDDALAQVGLQGYADRPAQQLSAGQQRRVDLARLYLSDDPLWLLDEPFTAIDREGVAALQQRFEQHLAGGGAVLLTSHQPLSLSSGVRELHLEGVAS